MLGIYQNEQLQYRFYLIQQQSSEEMNKIIILAMIGLMSVSAFDIDFALLLQTGSESNDAVQAVYDLLNDLKTSNIEAQGVADEKNISDEEIGQARIAALSKVNELNQKAWASAKARREQIGIEYREATDYIAWATQRLADIDRRSVELQELRCFSNGLFVRAIKQHNDALGVIRVLKNDLSGYLTGQPSSLVEINVQNVSDKLKQYSQLFNQDAMTKFAQLAAEQASGNAELHALGQENGSSSSTDRQPGLNVGQLVYNALSDLEDQLKSSLANLEANEIAAYYQLADWLADTESEVAHLNDEIQRKTQLQDKLVVQEQAALAVQAKANSVLKDSQNAINAATASLYELRDLYETELNRRNEENAIIDEVIHIFKQQVLEMANQTSYGKK
ncbi:unnamed protein product (macronuclear) [Paramecium tetraurelia]|uniref:Uncharacterized protein n=1 Tax=Paramecium tetraurelia TaxID=5888 RepID=A0BVG2_PARTE|nr:uncharacterized protein GSPATT00005775001 [Paramecium tetraurelia]CAK62529.1 unnamed protein product [Paramecium tetraurelia]|eukprot:XP_001429927.1 hypothetical protein (macronuclear) [Paramecium tetraurelia strain d4-2]